MMCPLPTCGVAAPNHSIGHPTQTNGPLHTHPMLHNSDLDHEFMIGKADRLDPTPAQPFRVCQPMHS